MCLQVRMAKVKQVGLLAAGCQPWNKDVCAASGDRFAYCATLAIYIYQVKPLCSWTKSLHVINGYYVIVYARQKQSLLQLGGHFPKYN